MGLRYRTHVRALVGNPDLVFGAAMVVVFCDGDFWHGRAWRQRKSALERGYNSEYWVQKIESNRARDRRVNRELKRQGWTVVRLWETDIKKDPEKCAELVATILRTHRC